MRRYWRIIAVGIVIAAGILGVIGQRQLAAEAQCPSYVVQRGDTLGKIAGRYGISVAVLAQMNSIPNINSIYVGQRLCIATQGRPVQDPLEWSTPQEVHTLLIQAADRHSLPRSLVLAIAWQESNWTQHVIAWDGGIGTMQLMPYTARYLNSVMGTHYNPYQLYDNIELGTSYLRDLWNTFPTSIDRIISAYNEGAYAVTTRGIFNWHYVTNVKNHMAWIN